MEPRIDPEPTPEERAAILDAVSRAADDDARGAWWCAGVAANVEAEVEDER